MELVNSQGTTNQARTKHRGVNGDELPHGRVVVGEDLELGIEVEIQVNEACECRSRVTTGHRLQAVVDLVLVAGANLLGVVDVQEPLLIVALAIGARQVGLADS